MRNKVVILVLGVLLFAGGMARAVPVTIQITGNVTSVSGSAITGAIYVNDIFTGTYTYNSDTSDSDSSPQRGEYRHNSPYGIDLFIGGFEFKTDPAQTSGRFVIGIGDNVVSNGTNDYYSVHSDQNAYTNGLWVGGISWELGDSTHTAISSTALPVTAPVLSAWNYNHVEIYGGDNLHGFSIYGTVTQATLVPEPVTGILMAMGVLLLRRRR